jgi:hypothetical protein
MASIAASRAGAMLCKMARKMLNKVCQKMFFSENRYRRIRKPAKTAALIVRIRLSVGKGAGPGDSYTLWFLSHMEEKPWPFHHLPHSAVL